VWPDLQSLSGVWEFVRRPYQILWSESPSQRTYGGALFWTFLQERLGDPLAVHTWKRTCDAPWLLALREVLRDRHGRDFDELLAEFWQWNYRAGAADDGRHYLNGSRYPRLSYQAIARTFGPQVQSLPDNLVAGYAATNAILFLGPATHETLRITFDGAPELADRRVVSVAGTTWPNTHPLEIEQHPDVDGDCVFEISGWHLYDQVALLMTNYASAQDHQERLAFSWIAEELGAPVFDVEWKLPLNDLRARRLTNAPNPFSASTQIRYRAESGASTRLEVYDIAGRRIRSLVRDLDSPFGGDYQAIWDGTDDRRRAVSSGIYFLHLRTASWTETRRIDIVR